MVSNVIRIRAKTNRVNVTDPYISIEQTDEGAVVTVTDSRGSTQATIYNGVSIVSVEKTGTEGLVDTYTITFSDGNTTTYEVTNGKSYTVDDAMSDVSENPVQNKVVNAAIPKNVKDGTGTNSLIANTVSGNNTCVASGESAMAIGSKTTASGACAFASGDRSTASGDYSTAFGDGTSASGETSAAFNYAGAKGLASFGANAGIAKGEESFAANYGVTNGEASFACNDGTATGYGSFAVGNSTANGKYSFCCGDGAIANGHSQTVMGMYNVPQGTGEYKVDTDYAFILGNGSSNNARSNAIAIRWDGSVVLANGTVLTPQQLSKVTELSSALSTGTAGQFLMSDGNGGFTWANLADLKVYPGGVKL